MTTDSSGRLAEPEMGVLPVEAEAGNYFVAAYPPFSAWEAAQLPALGAALAEPHEGAIGLYVHLPFCQHKCDYCYYLSYIAQPAAVVDRYLDSLVGEMELLGAQPGVAGRPVSFVYFGGGTPSVLSPRQLRRLVGGLRSVLPWDSAGEVSYECAPRSVREGFLSALRESGVTRLSMGVQSFDDGLLKLNGRVHLSEDVERAYGQIRRVGFGSVNLDLMCGLMGETEEKWRNSVHRAIALAPESVTIYQTEIPYNTQLYRDLEAGVLPAVPATWEVKRERLAYGFEALEAAGYTVVSAYNAVRDPKRQRFLYQDRLWRGDDMLGLGVASFGYFDGVHYQNETRLESYEEVVERGGIPAKRAYELAVEERVVREFILQLKLGEVAAQPFYSRYAVDILRVFERPLQELEREGFLVCDPQGVRLTRAGLLRVDWLLPLFYGEPHRGLRYS